MWSVQLDVAKRRDFTTSGFRKYDQSGRKFKDDDIGERLDFAKRKLLVTLLNEHGAGGLQRFKHGSN